jgi:hypothetical protein
MSGASSPDLEALVTPRIRDAFHAAIGQIGKTQLLSMVGLDDQSLAAILSDDEVYVSVGLVTVVCQINKTHNDPDPAHSSLTECLKGTTIRIPPSGGPSTPSIVAPSRGRRRLVKANRVSSSTGPLIDKRGMRLLGFAANTISFFILGYFFGGVALSPLIGQASCIGVSTSPPSLAPCEGSFIGLVISAIGGLGYTYYYFVKKL